MKKENLSSYAFHHENGTKQSFKASVRINRENASIFVAEGLAFLEALEHVMSEHPQTKKQGIITNSLSVVEAIKNSKNTFKRHYIMGEFMNIIEKMTIDHVNMKILWVPSHTGIKGNEEADELA
jgi:ribonuclease HI